MSCPEHETVAEASVVAVSHVGHVRGRSEDRVVLGFCILGAHHGQIHSTRIAPGLVVAVLDGMGGHLGGDIAAQLAAEVCSSAPPITTPAEAHATVAHANRAIYDRMAEIRVLAGMGTTIAALTIVGDEVLVVNVGDSRVYHLDANRLVQLTVDDALSRTALTQSLGGEHQLTAVRPHVAVVPADEQRFLLATDGLFGHLDPETLEACVSDDDHDTVSRLLEVALEAGGPDNISIALVRTPTRHRG